MRRSQHLHLALCTLAVLVTTLPTRAADPVLNPPPPAFEFRLHRALPAHEHVRTTVFPVARDVLLAGRQVDPAGRGAALAYLEALMDERRLQDVLGEHFRGFDQFLRRRASYGLFPPNDTTAWIDYVTEWARTRDLDTLTIPPGALHRGDFFRRVGTGPGERAKVLLLDHGFDFERTDCGRLSEGGLPHGILTHSHQDMLIYDLIGDQRFRAYKLSVGQGDTQRFFTPATPVAAEALDYNLHGLLQDGTQWRIAHGGEVLDTVLSANGCHGLNCARRAVFDSHVNPIGRTITRFAPMIKR